MVVGGSNFYDDSISCTAFIVAFHNCISRQERVMEESRHWPDFKKPFWNESVEIVVYILVCIL